MYEEAQLLDWGLMVGGWPLAVGGLVYGIWCMVYGFSIYHPP
jgi:hypothetical protein